MCAGGLVEGIKRTRSITRIGDRIQEGFKFNHLFRLLSHRLRKDGSRRRRSSRRRSMSRRRSSTIDHSGMNSLLSKKVIRSMGLRGRGRSGGQTDGLKSLARYLLSVHVP